jgi:hypothetical protein
MGARPCAAVRTQADHGHCREHGLLEHGGEETLERWLTIAPTEAELKKNLKILNELCHSGGRRGDEFGADSEILLLAWCQDVADAAGGFPGLRAARDAAESEALKKISSALEITNSKKWSTLFG